jgi:hypothetical protein
LEQEDLHLSFPNCKRLPVADAHFEVPPHPVFFANIMALPSSSLKRGGRRV